MIKENKRKAVSRKEAAILKKQKELEDEDFETKKKEKREKDTRLSYSSASMLQSCPQKWYYYKVAKVEKDFDVQRSDALEIGTVFHTVLEYTMHGPKVPKEFFNELLEKYNLKYKKAEIHAMLLKYIALHRKSDLECIYTEYEIKHRFASGSIDAIMIDKKGYWYIVDLKTAKRVMETKLRRLHDDYQLSLYALFIKEIAADLNLCYQKFRGIRYRVTTKPGIKRKLTETYKDFVKRCYNSIESLDIFFYVSELDRKTVKEIHQSLRLQASKLRKGELKPTRNYNACDNYFTPCEYWSQCHGFCYSETPELKMIKV